MAGNSLKIRSTILQPNQQVLSTRTRTFWVWETGEETLFVIKSILSTNKNQRNSCQSVLLHMVTEIFFSGHSTKHKSIEVFSQAETYQRGPVNITCGQIHSIYQLFVYLVRLRSSSEAMLQYGTRFSELQCKFILFYTQSNKKTPYINN